MAMTAKEAFAAEVKKKEAQLSLAEAALLMAEHLTGPINRSLYRHLLRDMANTIRPKMAAAGSDRGRIEMFNHYLFEELRFVGNSDNYYHPHNSFLNVVLDQRRGIPITLSLVYLEIGWRLGLPLVGLGFPGHFMVGYDIDRADPLVIDVFEAGQILTLTDCLARFELPETDLILFKQDYIKSASKRAILLRMLLNLKRIYVTLNDWEAGYKTVDLMIKIEPDAATEIRDRGLIAYRLDRLQEAIYDIRHYLFLAPDSPDAGWLRQHLRQMEERLGRLN